MVICTTIQNPNFKSYAAYLEEANLQRTTYVLRPKTVPTFLCVDKKYHYKMGYGIGTLSRGSIVQIIWAQTYARP